MGTAGYMSPEQLKGHTIDQRSDVFSFGAILYEMLSGRRAFDGDSAAETMSAILKRIHLIYPTPKGAYQAKAVRFFVFPSEKAILVPDSQQISPDGTTLVYIASGLDGRRAGSIAEENSLDKSAAPQQTWECGSHRMRSGTRDGQRFIVNTIVGDSAQVPITVVLNWTADLKR
jgi:serine/threonine protein kinase